MASNNESPLAPRGEYRETDSGFLISNDSHSPNRHQSWPFGENNDNADIEPIPQESVEAFNEYFLEFALTQAALRTFSDDVLEPGWDVEAKIDDSRDEDMTEALQYWGQNCSIRAGEPGHDISNILGQCPTLRRVKPAVVIEKIGTTDQPDSIAALQMLKPSTMTARLRKNQNLVVQPSDNVPADHPRTSDGTPAAYVQYDSDVSRFNTRKKDPVPFAEDDILKLTYEPPNGSAWGRTIWPALAEPIDGLKQKIRDRNSSIRLAGHPHRIYSSDSWSKEQAQDFAEEHQKGSISAWDDEQAHLNQGFSSRVDFVPNTVKVQVVEGQVADITAAVKDDLEQIFSILPISKAFVAYEEDINQFVVEPQMERDDKNVDKERRFLERRFTPLFSDKADELAGGYGGEVRFHIRQPESENPLERSDFDAEQFATFVEAGANYGLPREFFTWAAGIDIDQFDEGWAADSLELDEDDDQVQEQFNN